MERRDFLKLTALGAAGGTFPNLVFGTEKRRIPYNVVFIMGDDFSIGEIGCYGSTECETPHIDKLADTGVRFETCWATPLCSPTRVELMTGRYGFRTNVFHNWMYPDVSSLRKNIFLPQILQKAGVKTAMAGKWHLIGPHPYQEMPVIGPPRAYGFDESIVTWGIEDQWVDKDTKYLGDAARQGYDSSFWQPRVVKNGRYLPTGADDYGPDICVDQLIDFISRHREQPFNVCYLTPLGHTPFYPTPDSLQPGMDRTRNDRGLNFSANVEYTDKLVGRLVETLDRFGLRERTIIIFTTDNGTPPAKQAALEEACRVPLIVNAPGILKISGTRDELIDFSDLFPTMVDLAGGLLPDDYVIDGRSFAPLLLGEPYREREWIFSYIGHHRMLRDRRWLSEGEHFTDCGASRDPHDYQDVTDSDNAEVAIARQRFEKILQRLPAPDEHHSLWEMYEHGNRWLKELIPNYSYFKFPGMADRLK